MLYTEIILNFFFPKLCIGCDTYKNYLCENCEANLTLAKDNLPDWIYVKYNYKDENIKKLLFKLKYFHVKSIANELALYSYLYLVSKIEKDKDYILVPIPVTAKRHRDRGYNQSKLIADSLTRENRNLKVLEILKRVKETKKLNKIKTREERQIELEDAFAIDDSKSVSLNSHIIIIDDIATTGASLYSARKTLIEYGFKKENILAFTIAH
jgi:ComF family protein